MNSDEDTALNPKDEPQNDPPLVPALLAYHLRQATINQEKKTRLAGEGKMPNVVLHASLVGYYTGLLTLLEVLGYARHDDLVIRGLLDLRTEHSNGAWPVLPREEAPEKEPQDEPL